MPAAPPNRRHLVLHLIAGTCVLTAGALEARFQRPELLGDDISYLDVANCIHAHDWRAALNPLWSIGYPLLLSCFKPFFAPTLHGELTAVFALNLVIYLAAWLAFLFFLKTAATFRVPHSSGRDEWDRAATLIPAACIFLCTQLCFGRVSSIGPDQLVSCLFFLASALVLRFLLQASARNGILLGLTLGLGYLAKAVFLPLSVILLATALLPYRGRLRPAIALSAPLALLALMLPYAAGLSWAIGRPTTGESGPLNYGFHVNQVPHWMGWQGGPPQLRHPLHPVHLLREHPAVFGFGEPFHVTYPPQFAMAYWYDGYKHFFSPVNAIRAIATNLHALEAVLHENWPFTLAILLCAALALHKPVPHPSRSSRWVGFPLWLPSLLGIALYLQVHLEGRYVAAFIAILAIAVGCPMFDAGLARVDHGVTLSTQLDRLRIIILIAGTLLTLYPRLKPIPPSNQWQIAGFLVQSGLKAGDKVASVSTLNDIRCTWAYAARLHIVADIGNDAYTPQDQQQDFDLFWNDAAIQDDVLRLFREEGAVAVIVPHAPNIGLTPRWDPIPGTDAYFLRL